MREIEGVTEQPEIPVLEDEQKDSQSVLRGLMSMGGSIPEECLVDEENDDHFEKPSKGPRYWMGEAPTECQLGEEAITDFFVDGKTRQGPWGFMCASCHSRYGYGLGTGKGQSYKKQSDGRWLKVGG